MNIFDIAQAIITISLTFVPWFLPNCRWYIKVIIALAILLLSVIISWLRLYAKLKALDKNLKILDEKRQGIEIKYKDIKTNHNALSVQFNEKIEKETKYRKLIENMTLAFFIALEQEDRPKIENIYRLFLLEQERLEDGGASDGKKY